MDNERRMYTEVYTTLTSMGKDVTDKLPEELKETIYNKADTSYPYVVKDLLPESVAMIAAILSKYLIN